MRLINTLLRNSEDGFCVVSLVKSSEGVLNEAYRQIDNRSTKLNTLGGNGIAGSRAGFRVGDWRVIYELHDDQLVMLVLEIGARGGIY